MRFTPKSEKDIAEAGLWPAGEYDFEVMEATEATSNAGNEMTHLQLFVYNAAGQRQRIDDYLVATDRAAYKIRHFAEATGMLAQYETGAIPAESMVGRSGRCKVIIAKDKGLQYPDKNAVADYVKRKDGAAARAPTPKAADIDDEIPF